MGTLAAGIKDIFSSQQTTATHLPTCQSDGTPTGRIGVAELASVLSGGDIDGALANATDTNFNDLYGRTSCYRFNGYTGNIYSSPNGYGIIKTTYTSVGYCEQTAYVFNNNSVYVRTKTSSSSSWASWSRCDNFGANTASELASLLGGVLPKGHITNINANTVLTTCAYSVNDPSYSSHNLPSQWGVLLTFATGTGDLSYNTLQIWIMSTLAKVYFRMRNQTNWESWKYLALTQ